MHKHYLTEEEFVNENPHLVKKPYYHKGLWWDQTFLGYSRPVFKYTPIDFKKEKPLYSKSFFGYSCFTANKVEANSYKTYMVLDGDHLKNFSMDILGSKKRNQVRKGFRECEVKPIADIENCMEDAREVCISHSLRGASSREHYHVSHTFFIKHADSWRQQMRKDFTSSGRLWFGAWYQNKLIAYLVTLQVNNTAFLEKAKLHSDFMKYCPMDALYFKALTALSENKKCDIVFNSPPQRSGLDNFKKQFLFKTKDIPIFISSKNIHKAVKVLLSFKNNIIKSIKKLITFF